LNISGILAKYKVLPTVAERALAPISSSSCGIDSIANPHLNNDLGAIIAFPDETFGLGTSRHAGENQAPWCEHMMDSDLRQHDGVGLLQRFLYAGFTHHAYTGCVCFVHAMAI
jgi:hypothetical protein